MLPDLHFPLLEPDHESIRLVWSIHGNITGKQGALKQAQLGRCVKGLRLFS